MQTDLDQIENAYYLELKMRGTCYDKDIHDRFTGSADAIYLVLEKLVKKGYVKKTRIGRYRKWEAR